MSKKDREDSQSKRAEADDRTRATPEARAAADPSTEDAGAEHAQLLAERDQLQEQLQRTLADLQNMRRRQGAELEEWRRKTIEGLCQELLPVLDNFHAALDFWDGQSPDQQSDATSLVEGVRMVRTLLSGALERHGLQEITAKGQPFDPNLHEAVGMEQSAGAPEGQVLKVLMRGYQLGDRVIRPTRVVVAGEPAGDTETE